jgi:hypothetical protein
MWHYQAYETAICLSSPTREVASGRLETSFLFVRRSIIILG